MSRQTLYFIAAIAFQVVVLAFVPARKFYTLQTGQMITIRTMPVDPYDFLSGYHVVLSYDISQLLEPDDYILSDGKPIFVVLIEGDDGIWSRHAAYEYWPDEIPEGAVILRGVKANQWGFQFGIEHFYIPEKNRNRIERDLRENTGKALADIKVDRFGRAALLRLRIEDRVYEY